MDAGACISPVADRRQQLRLFFSAELEGGAEFKSRRPVEEPGRSADAWPAVFDGFFRTFIETFRERVRAMREDETDDVWMAPLPQLWKINGDAVVFHELVYPDPAQRHAALGTSLRCFVEVVQELDPTYISKQIGVRGCVWTAGFPLRNKPIRVIEGEIEIIEPHRDTHDFITGDTQASRTIVTEYIGRDMDLGYRLAGMVPAKRIACSLDIAQFVTDLPDQTYLHVHHVGWRSLPGILGSMPYPILWLETALQPAARHTWETADGRISEETRKLLFSDSHLTKQGFETLATELDDSFPGHMIRAYASSSDMADYHRPAWNANEPVNPVDEMPRLSGSPPTALDRTTASADEVPPITLDDLNQILLFLQEHPDRAAELRTVLTEVATHDSYARWLDEQEYSGLMYRLDHVLAFENDQQRRLLELLRLVQGDVLRVKLHVLDGRVFMTDGLWISPSIRVFAFADESNLVLRACHELGWDNWATCVIDPATGCGHNLLRHPGKTSRLYGFDRSVRAVAYAAVNAAVNQESALIGVNDVTRGLPPIFDETAAERVLVLANMPFALVPRPDTIARSNDGGRHGYKLTLDLFDAVNRLKESMRAGSELRCVVLAYTLGCLERDEWVVPDRARALFGPEQVRWSIWPDEKLWRINGKKEQDNPMPLDRLKLKADCRFYVRDDAHRPGVRADYIELEQQLKGEGYDHLAYGVIGLEQTVAS